MIPRAIRLCSVQCHFVHLKCHIVPIRSCPIISWAIFCSIMGLQSIYGILIIHHSIQYSDSGLRSEIIIITTIVIFRQNRSLKTTGWEKIHCGYRTCCASFHLPFNDTRSLLQHNTPLRTRNIHFMHGWHALDWPVSLWRTHIQFTHHFLSFFEYLSFTISSTHAHFVERESEKGEIESHAGLAVKSGYDDRESIMPIMPGKQNKYFAVKKKKQKSIYIRHCGFGWNAHANTIW